jgi:hypothetical protein
MNARPCPFCGKTETLMLSYDDYAPAIVCSEVRGGCGAIGPTSLFQLGETASTEEEALKLWNYRKPYKPPMR